MFIYLNLFAKLGPGSQEKWGIVLILEVIYVKFKEEKFVKWQFKQRKVFHVKRAILTSEKDQITWGDNESLIRRIELLLLENLMLRKKSNQQMKK